MPDLAIETYLKEELPEYYEKYALMKRRFLEIDYTYWAEGFPGGNDHGPGHIRRVLEKLDLLIGSPGNELNTYELFLAMMAILYHDLGLLQKRKDHAKISGLILEEEESLAYIINEFDREIIKAAVVSHSHKQDIEATHSKFHHEEVVGDKTARPRLIAALVRLADELDEDHRRADPEVQRKKKLPEESEFFWRFCQRIQGIRPEQSQRSIMVFVSFEEEDLEHHIQLNGTTRAFIAAFAEKLSKINEERITVNTFLESLKYERLIVNVKLPSTVNATGHDTRTFILSDDTTADDFADDFAALWTDRMAQHLRDALDVFNSDPDRAEELLKRLDEIRGDLPPHLVHGVLFDLACLASHRAAILGPATEAGRQMLEESLSYISDWLRHGLNIYWTKAGKAPKNELNRLGTDGDLDCLLKHRRSRIVDLIPKGLQSALPGYVPNLGSGGCIPESTLVLTPTGDLPVEELREGSPVMIFSPTDPARLIEAPVTRMYASRAARSVLFNGAFRFTEDQPVYEASRGWIRASEVTPGSVLLGVGGSRTSITHKEAIGEYVRVFDLSTGHPAHSYFAYGIACHNKLPAWSIEP